MCNLETYIIHILLFIHRSKDILVYFLITLDVVISIQSVPLILYIIIMEDFGTCIAFHDNISANLEGYFKLFL